jgi:hypothetical protein
MSFFLFLNILFAGDRVKYVGDPAVSEADQRLLLDVDSLPFHFPVSS